MRKVTIALLALLGVLVGLMLMSEAAQAATHHKAHHKVVHVPTCPGFGYVHTGTQAWLDEHTNKGGLATNVNRLVCSAANYSVIDIKSWFFYANGPATKSLVADLHLMNRYHHVRVNILVGTERGPIGGALSFAHRYYCRGACAGPKGLHSISHAKWITVSNLRSISGGGHAVLSTSTNFTEGSYTGSTQSGIFVARDTTIYNTLVARYSAYIRCSTGRGCNRSLPNGGWVGTYSTKLWMEPTATDPTLAAVKAAVPYCSRGGTIEVMGLWMMQASTAAQLAKAHAAGCRVYLILAHAHHVSDPLRPRYWTVHDKFVVIDTPGMRQVIEGSQEFCPSEITRDDNQMMKVTALNVVQTYINYFARSWSRAHA